MPDPLDLGDQLLVKRGTGAIEFWMALAGSMQVVTRRVHLQNLAHRLDPERIVRGGQ